MITNKQMKDIREQSRVEAEAAWYGPDSERIRNTWHTLAAYTAFHTSNQLREANAPPVKQEPVTRARPTTSTRPRQIDDSDDGGDQRPGRLTPWD